NGGVVGYDPVSTNSGAITWKPTLTHNPQLVNNRKEGVGSTANLFLTTIVQSNVTNYVVYSPNGDIRSYQVIPFVLGTNLDLTRPYLMRWADNRGNALNF